MDMIVLNLFRFGLENSFFTKTPCGINRPLWINLWTNAFFNEKTIKKSIPKAYLDIEWKPFGYIFIETNGGWNFHQKKLDYFNTQVEWTVSDHMAFGLEYRYRSPYDWRKADFYNFTLETIRTERDLLASPLSDKRKTLLFRTFARLVPDWTIKLDLRYGWNRNDQHHYLEYQAELGTILYQHWYFQFIYEKREADNRFALSLKLDPGPPQKNKCFF